MPTKLHQIVAVDKDVKKQVQTDLTKAHHGLQQVNPLKGLSRTYQPFQEGGTPYQPEFTQVQIRARDVVQDTAKIMSRWFDLAATKEWANQQARADVVVDGKVILERVPVTYLLFLEDRLEDLHTFVSKLPALDPAEEWSWDDARGFFVTPPRQTTRTAKRPQVIVKYEATKEHPAQTELVTMDVPEGTWTEVKFSGALKSDVIRGLIERVQKLQQAVKFARQTANSIEVQDIQAAKPVFDYLFQGV